MPLLVQDDRLLLFYLLKISFFNPNKTYFIRFMCCHLTLCLHQIEPNCKFKKQQKVLNSWASRWIKLNWILPTFRETKNEMRIFEGKGELVKNEEEAAAAAGLIKDKRRDLSLFTFSPIRPFLSFSFSIRNSLFFLS